MKVLNYKKIKEDGLTLVGTVITSQEKVPESSDDILFIEDVKIIENVNLNDYTIEAEQNPVILMFRDRIGIVFQRGSLTKYIGNKISFKVEDINSTDDGEFVFASLRMIVEERRDKVINELGKLSKEGKTTAVRIVKIKNDCAYMVTKSKVPVIMRQRDFSMDWTPIAAVHKVGDVVDVVLDHVSPGKRIFVKLPTLYQEGKMSKEELLDKFSPNMSTEGRIMTVQPNCCFVRIAPGFDMLCPIPLYFDPIKGMQVKVRILQVNDMGDKGVRIRGKIVGEIDSEKFVLDLNGEEDILL